MSWKIETIAGADVGTEIALADSQIVGRDAKADIVLQGGRISRKHAAFRVQDDQLWLEDLNSSNGTYVNGVRITAATQLHHRDQLQFDVVQFLVLSSVALQAEQAAIDAAQRPAAAASTAKNPLAMLAVVVMLLVLIALSAWYFVA